MPVNIPESVRHFSRTILICLLCAFGLLSIARADDIATLFTTPAERQLINSNRYSDIDTNADQLAEISRSEELLGRVRGEITQSLSISGITVSNEGNHSVWINDQPYLDGDVMAGNLRLKIMVGGDIKVRITTSEGKRFYAASGETVEVSFLEGAEPKP